MWGSLRSERTIAARQFKPKTIASRKGSGPFCDWEALQWRGWHVPEPQRRAWSIDIVLATPCAGRLGRATHPRPRPRQSINEIERLFAGVDFVIELSVADFFEQ